jgi:hypothetical protein
MSPSASSEPARTIVLRKLHGDLITVQVCQGLPAGFRWGDQDFSVDSVIKGLHLARSGGAVQLWHVRAGRRGQGTGLYDLQCDDGEWRLAATWR